MSRIVQRPQAKLEIIEIADHIGQDDLDAALRFIEAIEKCFAFLAEFPESGEVWESSNPRYAGTRFWPVRGFPNHVIFFRPIRDGVEILAVMHGARDFRSLFG